jgi:hypothetical protein
VLPPNPTQPLSDAMSPGKRGNSEETAAYTSCYWCSRFAIDRRSPCQHTWRLRRRHSNAAAAMPSIVPHRQITTRSVSVSSPPLSGESGGGGGMGTRGGSGGGGGGAEGGVAGEAGGGGGGAWSATSTTATVVSPSSTRLYSDVTVGGTHRRTVVACQAPRRVILSASPCWCCKHLARPPSGRFSGQRKS